LIIEKALKEKNEDKDRFKNTIVTKVRGNKEVKALKYHAISPHAARRFFCSSLFYGWFKENAGWFKEPMPAAFIMRFSGHKTESSFVKYIGSSDAELEARTMEYFNNEQPQMKAS
jgi:integrase